MLIIGAQETKFINIAFVSHNAETRHFKSVLVIAHLVEV